MLALAAVMNGPSVKTIQEAMGPNFELLFVKLSDPNQRLRYATASVILQLIGAAPELVLENTANLQTLL
jgi:hypothetical protein